MSAKINIPGLNPIIPPPDEPTAPTLLSPRVVADLIRFGGNYDIVSVEDAVPALLEVQAECQYQTNIGENPELIGIEDFEIAVVKLARGNQAPFPVADEGLKLLFRSKKTKAVVTADAVSPMRSHRYHFQTALNLVAAATEGVSTA